jgi:hypothetical protein
MRLNRLAMSTASVEQEPIRPQPIADVIDCFIIDASNDIRIHPQQLIEFAIERGHRREPYVAPSAAASDREDLGGAGGVLPG